LRKSPNTIMFSVLFILPIVLLLPGRPCLAPCLQFLRAVVAGGESSRSGTPTVSST
jgi:hypothetical protein